MNSPEEIRKFDKGKLELTTFKNGATIGRITLEPGCIKVVMDDGSEEEFGPGDTAVIPPGHNAWVVGNEPVVAIDFTGLKDYAKEEGPQAQ